MPASAIHGPHPVIGHHVEQEVDGRKLNNQFYISLKDILVLVLVFATINVPKNERKKSSTSLPPAHHTSPSRPWSPGSSLSPWLSPATHVHCRGRSVSPGGHFLWYSAQKLK